MAWLACLDHVEARGLVEDGLERQLVLHAQALLDVAALLVGRQLLQHLQAHVLLLHGLEVRAVLRDLVDVLKHRLVQHGDGGRRGGQGRTETAAGTGREQAEGRSNGAARKGEGERRNGEIEGKDELASSARLGAADEKTAGLRCCDGGFGGSVGARRTPACADATLSRVRRTPRLNERNHVANAQHGMVAGWRSEQSGAATGARQGRGDDARCAGQHGTVGTAVPSPTAAVTKCAQCCGVVPRSLEQRVTQRRRRVRGC